MLNLVYSTSSYDYSLAKRLQTRFLYQNKKICFDFNKLNEGKVH